MLIDILQPPGARRAVRRTLAVHPQPPGRTLAARNGPGA
jgi:hypothetical protein